MESSMCQLFSSKMTQHMRWNYKAIWICFSILINLFEAAEPLVSGAPQLSGYFKTVLILYWRLLQCGKRFANHTNEVEALITLCSVYCACNIHTTYKLIESHNP